MDPPSAKRRRAQKACHFCRQRKMRCGNEEPNCLNCVAYKEVCYYDQGPKKARPSNSRISRLEEENRVLQERLAKTKAGKAATAESSSRSVPPYRSTSSDKSSDAMSGDEDDASASTPSPSRMNPNDGNPEYHGPTSVFFDDTAPKSKEKLKEECQKLSSGDASTNLMAEAAAQRQLENLHLSSSQLELDGVEPELVSELLSLFWTRSNPLFMLVYRPLFMRDWASGGPYFSKLLLNAIYFNASRYITDPKHGVVGLKLGERFRKRFKELLVVSYDKSRITTMQGLLLVAVSLSAVGKDRSLAWLYSGLGFRMMFDLGLHTSTPDPGKGRKISQEDLENNRRLFWSAFVIDKLQSFYQGRPANVQEADTMVPLSFHDQYEELERWHPLPSAPLHQSRYAPMYCVSNFFKLCQLAIIMNKILNKIYREKSEVQGPEAILKSLNQLNGELEQWRMTLPPHLALSPDSIGKDRSALPSPHIYVVLIMFSVVQILLHRPFVSYGHLQSVLPGVALDSFSTCAAAANCITQYLESYNRVHSFKFAPFFLFYASYVSATIHVRIAAQRHLNSDAFTSLSTCLSVFDQNELNNPAVKKAKAVIHKLMDRMGVKPPDQKTSRAPATVPMPQKKAWAPVVFRKEFSDESDLNNLAPSASIPQIDPLQGWNINDLDFDAILQSFGRPSPGVGGMPVPTEQFMASPDLISQGMNLASSTPGNTQTQPQPGGYEYMTQFGRGSFDDALFGFDVSSKENDWASPQSGSSSY